MQSSLVFLQGIFMPTVQMMKLRLKSWTNSPAINPGLSDLQFYGLFFTLLCAPVLKHTLKKGEGKKNHGSLKLSRFSILYFYAYTSLCEHVLISEI